MTPAAPPGTARLLLVNEHPAVREGVRQVAADERGIEVVGVAGAVREARAHIAARGAPDLVAVDLRLPDGSGVELCEWLHRRHPRVHTLVLAPEPTERDLLAGLVAGARGFVIRESDPTMLRMALRALAGGNRFVDPRLTGLLVSLATTGRIRRGPFGLTGQQLRVLRLLPEGLTNREIGRLLGISPETVKSHLRQALPKIGAANRHEAVERVRRYGLD